MPATSSLFTIIITSIFEPSVEKFLRKIKFLFLIIARGWIDQLVDVNKAIVEMPAKDLKTEQLERF